MALKRKRNDEPCLGCGAARPPDVLSKDWWHYRWMRQPQPWRKDLGIDPAFAGITASRLCKDCYATIQQGPAGRAVVQERVVLHRMLGQLANRAPPTKTKGGE